MMKNDKKIKKILNIQMIFMALALIFIVCSFFISALVPFREIVLGLILLMMAYSNQIIYKRKNMTIVYVIFGLILIITNIIKLF